ncbi:MAG: hypothetical protein CMQ21_01930 [Gammaproteobacteria bacterium]|nr:hypothetical protein [Gammaproteobacteria bacterium]
MVNAVVSFSDHTVSLVALVSNQRRNGWFMVGLGFNSIGRYEQSGILRERMIPWVLGAEPESLLIEGGLQFAAELAELQGKYNIATWDGHYYALEVVEQLGLLDKGGMLRIGFVH